MASVALARRVGAAGAIVGCVSFLLVAEQISARDLADVRSSDTPAATTAVSLVPTSGVAAGSLRIVVDGSGFETGATVTIGGVPATGVSVLPPGQISMTKPALQPGTLNDIKVTNPDATNGTLANGFFADFLDVLQGQPTHASVERILRAGITAGCGGGNYCPADSVKRQEMAVFLLTAQHGAGYVPPACTPPGEFADVPCPSQYSDWIEQLHHEGVTAGCGDGKYCPADPVKRQEMAVFLLTAQRGAGYAPPHCTPPGDFADVPCPGQYADWIEELFHQGVTGGCNTNPLRYCPSSAVSRGQMAVFLSVMFSLPNPPVSPYDWAQFHFEPGHSGNNAIEALVSRDNVASLAPLFSVSLPEVADGAPIIAVNVATASGPRNVVFVTTKAGRISARNAKTGAVVWETTPPAGPNYTTSSPALDPGRQFVYGYALDGQVHKYNTADGNEVTSGGWPEVATLKPDVEKGSGSLAIATSAGGTSYLYAPNGGYPGDAGDYQGHVTTIRLSDGMQHVFNANCSDMAIHFVENGNSSDDCPHVQSAVWARVGVVYDARTDRIYAATGNGDFDGKAGGHDWGDTVFAISPDGTGSGGDPLDSYTPTNYQHLQDTDEDLGSTSPALLPVSDTRVVTALGMQSGKDAEIRLIDLQNLSRQGGPGHVGGELQIVSVPQGGQVLTAPAVWVNPADGATWAFVTNNLGISGLKLTFDSSGNPSLVSQWTKGTGGTSPIVVNGVLFFAGSGLISALDPTTGTVLWNNNGIGGIHWESPVLASGILYITDESGRLTAYAPGGVAP